MPDSQEEFLKDLEPSNERDPLNEPLTQEPIEPAVTDDEEEPGNRVERRLRAKLQSERESSIALAARLEALTEAQKFSRDTEISSFEEKAMRIYGNQTPENAAATELLVSALKEVKEEAKREARQETRDELRQDYEAVAVEEKNLDEMLEEIEDESRSTIDAPTRKAFYSLLERLSPKDGEGNIIEYADHHAVWEELQARKQPQNTRAKDLASRSMVRTGASPASSVETSATERWLKENGIL